MATTVSLDTTGAESVYIVQGEVSPHAIAKSLQALLPARHHPIARHRFTLLDTFDGRVRRAGARLTSTGDHNTSMVAWQPRGGGRAVAARVRQPVSFAWDLPESPLQQVLAPVIGVRRLLAQADAEAHGSLLDILDDRGKTVARLRIESGQVRLPISGSAWQPLPTTITLTSLRGYEKAYERLVPVIESRPGLKACPEGLESVMLRQVGASARADGSLPLVALAPTVRADVGARQVHLALLDILVANEPGLRANLDTEFLHDFRVAVRRTRALLGQIKHVFPPDIVQHFSTEFSWLGRVAGPARDMDVLILELRARAADASAADMTTLMAFLGEAQQREHHQLREALNSPRYWQLVSEWHAFLKRPDPSAPDARNGARPLAQVVSKRAWRLSRRIAGSAATIDWHAPAADLHKVRIDAKKLRYLVDVTPGFYEAADLECILGALKKLQRVLGDFNDAQVQEERLLECGRALGAAGGPVGALLAVGRLAEQRSQRRERLRGEVADKLAGFCARHTRSACRRAFKRARLEDRAR